MLSIRKLYKNMHWLETGSILLQDSRKKGEDEYQKLLQVHQKHTQTPTHTHKKNKEPYFVALSSG